MTLNINTEEEFLNELEDLNPRLVQYCFSCKQQFNSSNVFTAAGWRETQITATCEACFDSLFDENGDVKQ